jgi:hypothetical protein
MIKLKKSLKKNSLASDSGDVMRKKCVSLTVINIQGKNSLCSSVFTCTYNVFQIQ